MAVWELKAFAMQNVWYTEYVFDFFNMTNHDYQCRNSSQRIQSFEVCFHSSVIRWLF